SIFFINELDATYSLVSFVIAAYTFYIVIDRIVAPRSTRAVSSTPERRVALSTERVERRLTAILAADVAGYSRLTGMDEEGTHARLTDHLRTLVDPKIAEHRGRIVKHIGDGFLAEFSSVVDAVRCAVDIQRDMTERNAAISTERRIEFRIG